jgi:hypothetical protein
MARTGPDYEIVKDPPFISRYLSNVPVGTSAPQLVVLSAHYNYHYRIRDLFVLNITTFLPFNITGFVNCPSLSTPNRTEHFRNWMFPSSGVPIHLGASVSEVSSF